MRFVGDKVRPIYDVIPRTVQNMYMNTSLLPSALVRVHAPSKKKSSSQSACMTMDDDDDDPLAPPMMKESITIVSVIRPEPSPGWSTRRCASPRPRAPHSHARAYGGILHFIST